MLGLILEGSAMRVGFVTRALMALMDKGLANFDTAQAVSASVPTLAYFAAGQGEEAALAVPGCYPGTVCVCNHEYIDGGTVNPLQSKPLFHEKTDRIIAILSNPLDFKSDPPPNFFEKDLFWRYFHKYDWMLERLLESSHDYKEVSSFLVHLAQEKPPKAFVLCPDKMPPAGFVTRDRSKVNWTIEFGYEKVDCFEEKIRWFLI